MAILGLVLASLIGLSLGLLGGGGSILTVPVLVYVLGFPAKPAIAMSLPVVGVTSLVGAALHWRHGNVKMSAAAMFGAVAIPAAFVGARLAAFLSGGVQLVLLAVVMLAAAGSMLRSSRDATLEERASGKAPAPLALAMVAAGVGLITGVIGIGGGFLVVPALVVLAGVSMRQAIGTSLVVIVMNAAAAFAGQVGSVQIDWAFLAGFTAVAVGGALVGTVLSRRVPQATLKRGFAVFLLVVSSFILVRSSGS